MVYQELNRGVGIYTEATASCTNQEVTNHYIAEVDEKAPTSLIREKRRSVFLRLEKPTLELKEEVLEESSASCFNIGEKDEYTPNKCTLPTQGIHPWEAMKKRFMTNLPCISVRKEARTGHGERKFQDTYLGHGHSLEEAE
ncbi:hypothetical protein LIER_21846 [Lithospermum erythrorhizon]|uniref:Uncharacterized protein n=1 Tax=Lithospermum erythrorhizon TaxID=34254 RepID=A0AAV3QUS3_LITER